MKDTYQLVRLQDGKQDFKEIVEILQAMKSGKLKNDLKLLNYYHEVPVSYPVKIDTVEPDGIEVSTHQAQAVLLSLQKQSLLTSAAFPQGLGVHGFVEYINVKNCFAVLGRFAYASIRASRRGAVRVRVGEHIRGLFQVEKQAVQGELIDISLSGVALRVVGHLPAGLPEAGMLQLDFVSTSVAVPANIVKIVEIDSDTFCRLRIEPDVKADKVISQYLFGRQVEIIRDLKEQIL